jgi:hypothetical protein|tara:strand:- start:1887 stop:2012 length:126 start_codon:yes stop_codon:yes gene_type:complete
MVLSPHEIALPLPQLQKLCRVKAEQGAQALLDVATDYVKRR